MIYLTGEGIERDPVEGMQWLERAALHGHTAAQYNLAVGYAQGQGVEANPVEGYAWLLISDAGGVPQAAETMRLLRSTMTSEQVAASVERARALYEKGLQ